jgi:TM2 domain-containing membrane protein YozV
MYCKSCGKEMPNSQSTVCVSCGVPKGKGSGFCPNCGCQVATDAVVCVKCGCSIKTQAGIGSGAPKSKLVAGLLAIFLGALGIHNFYLGFTTKGIIQLLVSVIGGIFTCGIATIGIEIWALVEGIMILTGSKDTDAFGNNLSD